MKEYILMDWKGDDCFPEYYDTAEEGIKAGDRDWDHLTEREKRERRAFYLLKTVDPDPESEYHYDGDIIKDWKEEWRRK